MMETIRKNLKLLLSVILAATTVVCFWQLTGCDFVNFDDHDYLYANKIVQRGLTFDNIIWAFTTFEQSNWHPVTWISLMLDCQLWGLNPALHHSVNLLLHVLNTLLLFFILLRSTSCTWQSFIVALLFAIHPLHVESVAWIAERKDVLSTFWGFMALAAYVLYTEKPARRKLMASVFFFAIGLMSKPMLVSLPLIFLLFDYWPLKRIEPGKVNLTSLYSPFVKEKIPFFALSAASCVITLIAQHQANTLLKLAETPIDLRVANAFVSYVSYLFRTLWPFDLAVLYPYPDHIPLLYSVSAFAFIIVISVVSVRKASRYPYLFVGWSWYLLTLVPVIGFVRVGYQSMADRYTYIPLIGIFMLFSWSITDLLKNRPHRYAMPAIACILAVMLCPLTWMQTGYWKNSISLYEHALAVTDKNYVVLYNLGVARFHNGDVSKALDLFYRSVEINRYYPDPLVFIGHILSKQEKYREAIPYFQSALALKPNFENAQTRLGICYLKINQPDEAESRFREALKSNPYERHANLYLANLLISKGQAEEARSCWERILVKEPYSKEANLNLGNAAVANGNAESAISYFRNATRAEGDSPEARYNLGIMYAQKGDLNEAALQLGKAIKLNSDYPKAHNNLGNVLLLQGKTDEAIFHFREALRINPLYTLAKQNLDDALAYRKNRSN